MDCPRRPRTALRKGEKAKGREGGGEGREGKEVRTEGGGRMGPDDKRVEESMTKGLQNNKYERKRTIMAIATYNNHIITYCNESRGGSDSPASRRGQDKQGFHRRATHFLHFAIFCVMCAHVATFCYIVPYVVTFCQHFPMKVH